MVYECNLNSNKEKKINYISFQESENNFINYHFLHIFPFFTIYIFYEFY